MLLYRTPQTKMMEAKTRMDKISYKTGMLMII
jgi:hypothetical protein